MVLFMTASDGRTTFQGARAESAFFNLEAKETSMDHVSIIVLKWAFLTAKYRGVKTPRFSV